MGSSKGKRSASDPPSTIKQYQAANENRVVPTKHTIEGLNALAKNNLESTFKPSDELLEPYNMAENDLNEILEQESMEVDTPMQPTRIVKNIK